MLIGLVRHGETDWNAVGRTQGQTDIPLNEAGVMQAKLLASRLSREERVWDAVISSDLKRARETASIIAETLGIPLLEPDARFKERFFGEAEGTTEAERIQRWGNNWRELDLGAESDETMRSRGLEAISDLIAREGERNILIVSHGSFIATMLKALCSTVDDSRLSNLSYSILERQENGWRSLLHNCTRHLEDLNEANKHTVNK